LSCCWSVDACQVVDFVLPFPATLSLVWSPASAIRLELFFPDSNAIQDHILIPSSNAEEPTSFPAPFVKTNTVAPQRFRNNEVLASVTSAQFFLPKVAFTFVKSALGSSSPVGDRAEVAFKGASSCIAFDLAVFRSSQIRAKRMINSLTADWSSPTAFTLVHHFKSVEILWLLPFSRSN